MPKFQAVYEFLFERPMIQIQPKLYTVFFCFCLVACDIQPISTGNWQTQTDIGTGTLQSSWTISSDETLLAVGEWNFSVAQVELDGSRIAFSGQIPLTTGTLVSGNFSGTVSGNALQGTFFTTAGNFTVSGERSQ